MCVCHSVTERVSRGPFRRYTTQRVSKTKHRMPQLPPSLVSFPTCTHTHRHNLHASTNRKLSLVPNTRPRSPLHPPLPPPSPPSPPPFPPQPGVFLPKKLGLLVAASAQAQAYGRGGGPMGRGLPGQMPPGGRGMPPAGYGGPPPGGMGMPPMGGSYQGMPPQGMGRGMPPPGQGGYPPRPGMQPPRSG